MCSAPDVPTVPERQQVQLPDQGAAPNTDRFKKMRRAVMAGMITPPSGALGNPNIAKPTLG